MESSGLRGWIRLVEALWARPYFAKNGPTRTRNGPKRSKKSKKIPKTRKTTRSYQLCWVYCILFG
jgi:hypothetical protein